MSGMLIPYASCPVLWALFMFSHRQHLSMYLYAHTNTPQMASDVAARAQATIARKKQPRKTKPAMQKCTEATVAPPAPPALNRNKSTEIAKNLNLKRADYPPDIVKFVMGLRAASYKAGGTDLRYLFRSLDIDNSGDLNLNEFKLALRRFVCHACHCVCRVDLEGVTFMLGKSASYCLNLLSQFSCTHARR